MSCPKVDSLPQRIHMVGILGIGLSAIARILAARGHQVSGSDLHASPIRDDLERLDIEVHIGHAAGNVVGADLLIVSSAIPESNPEIQAAKSMGIPVLKRQDVMARIMAGSDGIAVAGTHGKTTTSAMIAVIFERMGLSPTFIVGGMIAELGTNAGAGRGPHFVIEADEYDHMFHGLNPWLAVVTNVEMDHPDCYQDIADMRAAYDVFLTKVSLDGGIVACADSPELVRVLRECEQREQGIAPVVTYGRSREVDYVVRDVQPNERGGVDYRIYKGQEPWETVSLCVAGAHNALNATAALIVADRCGLERHRAAQVLSGFKGVLRRFEIKGECQDIVIIDDYAHHPTQVSATLSAARLRYPKRRIWVVLQPHTYSRTVALLHEFSNCFGDADRVIITDIYAARLREKATISGRDLADAVVHEDVRYLGTLDEVVAFLLDELSGGDLLLTCGAGNGYTIGERVLAELEERGKR